MKHFVYYSSWDELTWNLELTKPRRFFAFEIPWSRRLEFRNWINECCSNTVHCWNGASTPEHGSQNWEFIAPHQNRCWLTFDSVADETMFLTRYGGNAVTMCEDISKVWHKSRSIYTK